MKTVFRPVAPLLLVLGLAACAAEPTVTEEGYLIVVPEQVVAMAAPYQDLTAVQLNPNDGCYWYRHENAVEVTMLPLRTNAGNPICTVVEAPTSVETTAPTPTT